MLPTELQNLVDKFRDNIESYKQSSYNETQLRREFLDKFIKILGWDVDNEEGVHESFKEVIHEDKLRVGATTKAPDYCIQIGGKKLFYIEAKKPSVNIKDTADAAFQVRRYGWTAKMPVCLLTDFEEFSVYNTGTKPKNTDKSSAARFFYCRYDELDKKNPQYPEYENNWSYLESLFSKNAVKRGSLEKIKSRDKKGTQEVDKEFLKEIEDWREQLTNNIVLRNELAERELNFAVQKIIDRIIFLRICEDRGIETKNTLQNIAKNNEIYSALKNLFLIADNKYNSGLFHFHKEQGYEDTLDTFTLDLKIDDKPLRNIIKSLYDPAPYVFSVMPADILGSIYERFLGKVIRLTSAHRAKIEEKPEVRKAGGVYYTPEYIVNYIAQNTIGKLLAEKTPKSLKGFRVLDPACGSGSFLINAYQFLLDWYLREYVKNADYYCKQKILVKTATDSFKLSIRERKRILTEHIFGVDIDIQAVEVTKLSLLLKALEGLQEQEIQGQLFNERILPNLGNNIKCGNSLIGSDFYAQGSFDFSDDEKFRINCFDWEVEFKDVFKDGGFDVVIGNPPYVNIENLDKNSKKYFFSNYKTCQGRTDIYVPFIEKNIKNLNKSGTLAFIIPYAFTNQLYGTLARENIIKNMHIQQIVDTSNYYVFESAVVKNIILILRKNKTNDKTKIVTYNSENDFIGDIKTEFKINQNDFLRLKDNRLETKPLYGKLNLKETIRKKSIPLEKICFIGYGARLNHKTKDIKKSYYIHAEKKHEYKPFMEGKNIERFSFSQDGWLDYRPNEHYNSMFPELFESEKLMFINVVKDRIRFAYDDKKFYNSHTVINCVRYDNLTKANHVSVKKALKEINISECKDYSIKYLLGILNSNLLNWYFVNFLSESLHFYPNDAKCLPIRKINFTEKSDKDKHDKLVSCVEQMLELKKKEQAEKLPQGRGLILREINALEKKIDEMVYELYGLSEEEKAVVEGK